MVNLKKLLKVKCACGCGELINAIGDDYAPRLYKKGHQHMNGERATNWRGGIKHRAGYILIIKPDHPRADSQGYVKEHWLVMEAYLGRYLTDDEVVHHINQKRDDNRLENLQLMTKKQHSEHHSKLIKRDKITGLFEKRDYLNLGLSG